MKFGSSNDKTTNPIVHYRHRYCARGAHVHGGGGDQGDRSHLPRRSSRGGVNLETAGEFLKAGACAVAVGGELVDAKAIKDGRFDTIEERTRQYLAAIAKARGEMKAA